MAPRSDERSRFCSALLGLCSERGYRAVAVADLVAATGLDRDDFARCFVDLEDCFVAAFDAQVDQYRTRFAPRTDPLAPWRVRVRATLYALYRFLLADSRRPRFFIVEVRAAGERVQRHVGERIEALFDLIDAGRGELADPAGISRATAEAVGGGILNQLYAELGSSGSLRPEGELVPQLMYSVALPYLGRAAALEELRLPAPAPTAEPPDSAPGSPRSII